MSRLLDTDVICQPATLHGDPRVIARLERERDRCYTSAVVVADSYISRNSRTPERRRSHPLARLPLGRPLVLHRVGREVAPLRLWGVSRK